MPDNVVNKKKAARRAFRLGPYTTVLAVVWTAIVGVSLAWNLSEQGRATKEVARTQARAGFEKDVLYRRWNAMHGGVYVPATEKTPPNAYLDVSERDIETPAGRKLTLVNPAYMTRQVHELGAQTNGTQGHITSLKPIRPENAADPWETAALVALERGEAEHSSIDVFRGEPHLRLMRPFFTEKGCLKCHAVQGYQVGDIRGGVSVSVPMEPLWAIGRATMISIAVWHGFFWVLGLGGIGLSYRHLRARIRERDRAEEELEKVHRKLVESARLVGKAEVATDVIHNVGNVLNSVQVGTGAIKERIAKSKVVKLGQVVDLVGEHSQDLGEFFTTDERGKKLPLYLAALHGNLTDEQHGLLDRVDRLGGHIEHLVEIVNRQQSHTGVADFAQTMSIEETVEDAVQMCEQSLARYGVELRREYASLSETLLDRHKILQIITNLLANAVDSLSVSENADKTITLRIQQLDEEHVRIEVSDSGIGIPKEDLTRIFNHGFTTKADGHGFGLHSAALAAKEMDGSLVARSDGVGQGATFSLEIPIACQEAVHV